MKIGMKIEYSTGMEIDIINRDGDEGYEIRLKSNSLSSLLDGVIESISWSTKKQFN